MWHRAGKVVSDENLLMSYFVKVTGRYKHHLQAALTGDTQWEAELEAAGKSATGKLSRFQAQTPSYLRRRNRAKGIRSAGGVRQSEVSGLYPVVKSWFESESAHGNYVDKADVASEFVRVAEEVVLRLEQQ